MSRANTYRQGIPLPLSVQSSDGQWPAPPVLVLKSVEAPGGIWPRPVRKMSYGFFFS